MERFFCQQCFKKLEIHSSFAKFDENDFEKVFGLSVNFPQSSSSVQESPRKTSSTQAQMVPPSSMTTRTSKTSPVKAQASITSPRTPLPSVPTTFEGFVLIESNPTERILKYNRVHKRVVITSNKKSSPTENQKNRTPEQKQFTSSESHVSASLSTDTDVLGKLFDLVTSELEIDMPLCSECAQTVLNELNSSLEESQHELKSYQDFLLQLETEEIKREDETLFENEIESIKKEERELKKELEKVLKERERLQKLMTRLKEEEERKSKFEQRFWNEYGLLRSEQESFLEERHSIRQKLKSSWRRLENIRQQHILNECFHIWFEGPFGTINGLRLGRLSSVPVEWSEINAAWGFTVHLTYELTRRLKWEYPKYKLIPMGSQSRLEALDNDSAYELFADRDAFFRMFVYRRFDNGMVAFLEYIQSLADHITQDCDSSFRLPHKIEKDRIERISIKLQQSSEEEWTKALKYLLTNVKAILCWVVQNEHKEIIMKS